MNRRTLLLGSAAAALAPALPAVGEGWGGLTGPSLTAGELAGGLRWSAQIVDGVKCIRITRQGPPFAHPLIDQWMTDLKRIADEVYGPRQAGEWVELHFLPESRCP